MAAEGETKWFWELGDWSGMRGSELTLYDLTCPYCHHEGDYETAAHFEKAKSTGRKKLNFDTLKCGNCGNFHMVLWSASSHGAGGMHGRRQLPWPTKRDSWPEDWPDEVGKYWIQVKKSIDTESWDAAVLVAASAMQAAMREQNAQGSNLFGEIDDLTGRGVLPSIMSEWAHELRILRNMSAHPETAEPDPTPDDVKAVSRFLDYLFEYLYTLPSQISDYRKRKSST